MSLCGEINQKHLCEHARMVTATGGWSFYGCVHEPYYAENQKADAVNPPEHYTSGGIECIDAIRASLGLKEFADYCKGNVIKYVWRYRHKNGVEDLKKARVYLNWMIAAEEGT